MRFLLPFNVVEGKNGAAVIECDIDGKSETFYAGTDFFHGSWQTQG